MLTTILLLLHVLFAAATPTPLLQLAKGNFFRSIIHTEEIAVVLVQSNHGSNKNVSVGYKIEKALQSLSTKQSIYTLAHVDTRDTVYNQRKQEVAFGTFLAKSLHEGTPCLLLWQWGLKSMHTPIPISAATLGTLVRKRQPKQIKQHLLSMLNRLVPMSSSMRMFQGKKKNKKAHKWLLDSNGKDQRTVTRVMLHTVGHASSLPAWYKRLSLLYDDGRGTFGYVTTQRRGKRGG